MADWIDGIALLGTLGSLLIARSALKLSRDAHQLQQRISLAQIRPWVVMKGPCILTGAIVSDQPVPFAQWITVEGTSPAVRLRVESYWEILPADQAKQHSGIARARIQKRIGDGTLTVLAPGQSQCVVNSSDRKLSSDDYWKVLKGSHLVRIVIIVEYEHTSSPSTTFRTTTAATCGKEGVRNFNGQLALPPVPDGFHLE